MNYKTAVILCGGKGTRLGELGKKLPKTLVKVQNKPIIWYILKSLKKNDFNHFILPIGFKGDQIKKYLKKNKYFKNYKIDVIETGTNSSIAKRIFKIKKYIRSENFLILNGDAIFHANLNQIYRDHKIIKRDISFICSDTEADFGTIGIKKNKIVDFRRGVDFRSVNTKVKNYEAHVYSGMSIINKKILKENFKNYDNFEKDFYPKIINKYNAGIYTLKGFWYAMDNIKDLEMLNKKNINKKIFNKIKNFKLKYFND